jgi:hypothetical protein
MVSEKNSTLLPIHHPCFRKESPLTFHLCACTTTYPIDPFSHHHQPTTRAQAR